MGVWKQSMCTLPGKELKKRVLALWQLDAVGGRIASCCAVGGRPLRVGTLIPDCFCMH
jgi:hypothetical protein